MNLLFAIVILISLIWGQVCVPVKPESLMIVIGKATFVAALAPAFAAFQVWIFKRHHATQSASHRSKRFRAMAIAHIIVWAILSISVIALVRWIDVAFLVPKYLPLVDELILVAPALLSLIASWAIFIFCLPDNTIANDNSRTSLFLIWLRMQVMMLIAPVLFAFFVSDCFLIVASTSLPQSARIAFWTVASSIIIGAVLLYPRLMLLIWSTRKVEDPDLEARCMALFERAGLRPRSVRVWNTNDTVINAAAIGIVPGTEVIVISDLLIQKFDQAEVDAIIAHEIGHVRHLHCIKRITMVLVPLILLAMDQAINQATGFGLHNWIAANEWLNRTFGTMTQFLPAIAFLAYLWLITKTIFRNMEYEADSFATKTLFEMGENRAVQLALEKMAVIYPRLANHRSGLHPSVRQRLANVLEVESRLVRDSSSDTLLNPIPALKSISLDPMTAK